MYAFILAGGFATRLWPLTEKRAKPLLPLAGTPIIEHLVRGIPDNIPVTVSTNSVFRRDFEEWKERAGHDNLQILIEDTAGDDHKLGALGATAQWITQEGIDDDVLLLTGDNYCGFRMQDFLAAARPGVTLIAAHDIGSREKARSFGTVILDEKGTVSGFEEKPQDPRSTLVNTGCSLLPASVLSILVSHARTHPDNVGGIFEELLRRGEPVDCFTFSDPWFDIGSFEAYVEATRTLVGNRVVEEEGASVEQTVCNGSVVIGPRTMVRRCSLENVVLFEECTIEDCHLRNCVIDRHCTLRNVELEEKMIREETRLERSTQ